MAVGSPLLLCRLLLGVVCALVWGIAVWRLTVGEGGSLEASVAAGGWGLSLLPVHVAAGTGEAGAGQRARAERQWNPEPGPGDPGGTAPGAPWRERRGAGAVRTVASLATRASRRRRWGGGSGRS